MYFTYMCMHTFHAYICLLYIYKSIRNLSIKKMKVTCKYSDE